ncbi:MAG TPA: ABC transporter ATP-binding protein [Bacillota bacterium]|nr:ABC transporter ATP-binding protein [Bacillota bacterium]
MKLELLNVTKTYQGRTVLQLENIIFESGKKYAILGPNGSGKTTLLRIASAILKADQGAIHYNGDPRLPGERIAYLPQKPYLFNTTVQGNLTFAMDTGTRVKRENARMRAECALEALGMKNFSRAKAGNLSGGEAQKVALLRTLVLGKDLVLLDEPTAAVDMPSMKRVEDYITNVIRKNHSTLIFSTHNPSQAARMADEIIILWDGRMVEKGPCHQVLFESRQKETREFLQYWAVGIDKGGGAVALDHYV